MGVSEQRLGRGGVGGKGQFVTFFAGKFIGEERLMRPGISAFRARGTVFIYLFSMYLFFRFFFSLSFTHYVSFFFHIRFFFSLSFTHYVSFFFHKEWT